LTPDRGGASCGFFVANEIVFKPILLAICSKKRHTSLREPGANIAGVRALRARGLLSSVLVLAKGVSFGVMINDYSGILFLCLYALLSIMDENRFSFVLLERIE